MENYYKQIKNIFINPYYVKKYTKMTWALVLLAVIYNLFVCSIHLVAGGAGGLGVLCNYLFNIEPFLVVFFISFIMFILAFIYLDAEQVVSTLFVTFVYPLLVKTTSGLGEIIIIDINHVFIIVLFGAIFTGVGQGVIFKLGLNFGGFSVLANIISKYFNVSVTFVNAFINIIIVLLGAFFLGFEMLLYACLYIIVSRRVSEMVVLGTSNHKTFKIISSKYDLIENFVMKELGHDVTIYDAYGAYNKSDTKLLMVVVPTSEFTVLRDYVKNIDKNAFMFVANTYEVKRQDVMIGKELC